MIFTSLLVLLLLYTQDNTMLIFMYRGNSWKWFLWIRLRLAQKSSLKPEYVFMSISRGSFSIWWDFATHVKSCTRHSVLLTWTKGASFSFSYTHPQSLSNFHWFLCIIDYTSGTNLETCLVSNLLYKSYRTL